MKVLKKLFKWFLYFSLIPIFYFLVSLLLTSLTFNQEAENKPADHIIYLSTNGVHLDIVIPKKKLDRSLLLGLKTHQTDHYFAFGWGDENFYINTPSWSDLTFLTAFRAMFLKSDTLLHVTRYQKKQSNWKEIKVTDSQLQQLSKYLLNTFEKDQNGLKIILDNEGYSFNDDFYKSKGSYSCFKTCNTWVNTGFKESGLKSCLWTPFDFGLLKKYE